MSTSPFQGLYESAQKQLGQIDHSKVHENTLAALAKPYNKAEDLQKAINDTLWGIDGVPEANGPGAYNIPLMEYRKNAANMMLSATDGELKTLQDKALTAYKAELRKKPEDTLTPEEMELACIRYLGKNDPLYNNLASEAIPYVSTIRDTILHTETGKTHSDGTPEKNSDLAPFVGANTTIVLIDRTSPKAVADRAKMLKGEISASDYYKEHSTTIVQSRLDKTRGASGGGLGNTIPTDPDNLSKFADQFVDVCKDQQELQKWVADHKNNNDGKDPEIKDLQGYFKGKGLNIQQPTLEPYLHQILENKPITLEDHHQYIDNLKLVDGKLQVITDPKERADKTILRETREELSEAYGINDKFGQLKALCEEQHVAVGGNNARDPNIILTSGLPLAAYEPTGKDGMFPPTYTAGQQCCIMEVKQDKLIEARALITEITSQKVQWRGVEVAGLSAIDLTTTSNMASCEVHPNGHVEVRRGPGPHITGYDPTTVFCYPHEGQVHEVGKYNDLKAACIENFGQDKWKQEFQKLYMKDMEQRAHELADMSQPRIIDYHKIAHLTKEGPHQLRALACEHFAIDPANEKEAKWAEQMLAQATAKSREIYFSKHPQQKELVAAKELEAMQIQLAVVKTPEQLQQLTQAAHETGQLQELRAAAKTAGLSPEILQTIRPPVAGRPSLAPAVEPAISPEQARKDRLAAKAAQDKAARTQLFSDPDKIKQLDSTQFVPMLNLAIMDQKLDILVQTARKAGKFQELGNAARETNQTKILVTAMDKLEIPLNERPNLSKLRRGPQVAKRDESYTVSTDSFSPQQLPTEARRVAKDLGFVVVGASPGSSFSGSSDGDRSESLSAKTASLESLTTSTEPPKYKQGSYEAQLSEIGVADKTIGELVIIKDMHNTGKSAAKKEAAAKLNALKDKGALTDKQSLLAEAYIHEKPSTLNKVATAAEKLGNLIRGKPKPQIAAQEQKFDGGKASKSEPKIDQRRFSTSSANKDRASFSTPM